jgi:hypothetical protein
MIEKANEIKLLTEGAHDSVFLVGKINKLMEKKNPSKLSLFANQCKSLISKKLFRLRKKIRRLVSMKTSGFSREAMRSFGKKAQESIGNLSNKQINISFDFLFQPVRLPDFKKIMNQEVTRVDVLILLNIAIIVWMATIGSVPRANSEQYADKLTGGSFQDLTNFNSLALAAESKIVAPGCDDRSRCDFDMYNYLEKKCDVDKDNKRNSETCGIDQKDPSLDPPKVVVIKARAAVVRRSCRNDDKPSYSDTKGKHMDEDCCPDPDEWPKPGCVYSASDYAVMLSGPAKKK